MGSPKPTDQPAAAGEDDVLEFIREMLGNGIEAFGLRDDAGLVEVPGGGSLVVSVDSVVAGVHLDLALCTPADVGWKALMGALSDRAAMGAAPFGSPGGALCDRRIGGGGARPRDHVGGGGGVRGQRVPGRGRGRVLGGFGDGGRHRARDGRPVATSPSPRSGAPTRGRDRRDGALWGFGRRPAGAQASAPREGPGGIGAAYRRPVARLREGAVARRLGAHAMIDVSDGLALDLHRLADASGVGFRLDDVPVAAGATLEEALGGGEDYELVFTVSPAATDEVSGAFAAAGLRSPARIGAVSPDPAERTLRGRALNPLGWQHTLG